MKYEAEKLSKAQRDGLLELNEKLRLTEYEIEKEVKLLNEFAEARIKNSNSFISDYELDVVVTFILKESDPEWNDDDDNILVELKTVLFYGKGFNEWEYYKSQNHNDFTNPIMGHPMKDENHCWLYHSLYDHTSPQLDWGDILRIGSSQIDFRLTIQN